MKKTKNLFRFGMIMSFIIFFIACSNEGNNEKIDTTVNKVKFEKMDTFFGAKIGEIENSKVRVVVDKNDLLKFAKDALKINGLNLEPYDCEIIDQKGVKYLRIFSQKNYVSTVKLNLEENNSLRVANTICSSTVCASGGGCIPDGQYCSPCSYSNGLPSSDCSRVTSGG